MENVLEFKGEKYFAVGCCNFYIKQKMERKCSFYKDSLYGYPQIVQYI